MNVDTSLNVMKSSWSLELTTLTINCSRKDWLGELGYYDPGMEIWGGEQLELSFKVGKIGQFVY